jgi:hypothetical protein
LMTEGAGGTMEGRNVGELILTCPSTFRSGWCACEEWLCWLLLISISRRQHVNLKFWSFEWVPWRKFTLILRRKVATHRSKFRVAKGRGF